MSLSIPGAPNAGLFKQGYQKYVREKTIAHALFSLIVLSSYESEDGAVVRNIEACRAIAQTVQTSLGPYGRNKIVINHLQKMILTSDAASILRELDVVHPAAKLIVMASQQQEAEMGDATNMVIVLAGELLKKAEELLRMGLKTSDVVQGYERAQKEALRCLDRAYAHLTTRSETFKKIKILTVKQNWSWMKLRIYGHMLNSARPYGRWWHPNNVATKISWPELLLKQYWRCSPSKLPTSM